MTEKEYRDKRFDNKAEYNDKRLDLFQEYTAEQEKTDKKFIRSNAKYKKGDFVQGTNGLIICIDMITIYERCDHSLSFIYYGPAYTKSMERRKMEPKKFDFREYEIVKKVK